jgi:hypothetical protein
MEWATRYQTEQAAKQSIFDVFLDDITGRNLRPAPRTGQQGAASLQHYRTEHRPVA